MANVGGDLYVFGGWDENGRSKKSIYRLTCIFRECYWTELKQKLMIARDRAVAIPVSMDSFCSLN